jgi:hypothetical protein
MLHRLQAPRMIPASNAAIMREANGVRTGLGSERDQKQTIAQQHLDDK